MLQLTLTTRVSERYRWIWAPHAFGLPKILCPVPDRSVEVWVGGDDGLTQRLRDAIEHAFQSSPRFVLSSGKKSGALVVTIPASVRWKQFGKRTQVFYRVEFATTDQQKRGASKGSCWDDESATCAAHIVGDAEVAARGTPH